MKLAFKLLGGAAVVALLGWFAYVHSGQTVDLRFGLFTLRGIPLSLVIYAAVVARMAVMLGVGLWSELGTKRPSEPEQRELAAELFAETEPADEVVFEELDREM